MQCVNFGRDLRETSCLLVECISELGSHEQRLQEAVQVAGHRLVDQADVTCDNRRLCYCDGEVLLRQENLILKNQKLINSSPVSDLLRMAEYEYDGLL